MIHGPGWVQVGIGTGGHVLYSACVAQYCTIRYEPIEFVLKILNRNSNLGPDGLRRPNQFGHKSFFSSVFDTQ